MTNDLKYDWVKAILEIVSSDSRDFGELAAAAQLDPLRGDLSDADFRGLDLSDQNLAGWDLTNAKLGKANLNGTELRGARVSPSEIAEAIDWREANLDDDV